MGVEECYSKMADRAPFWLLAAFLCIVFFTGGSSWDSEPQLMLLRPAALMIAGCAILTLRWEHISRHWVVSGLFLGVAFLTAAHLVPLPFEWWSAIPGRDIIVEIDQVTGLGQISRPLSMSPDATLNVLYSLSVPLVVFLLAVQLSPSGHRRILILLLALAALSGLFGLLQAGGADISFYPAQTPTSGLFANRNHQGALLALMIPLAAAIGALGASGRASQFASAAVGPAVAVIAIPLLLVTGSRSALIVAASGIVFAAFIWPKAEAAKRRPLWQRAALPAGLALSVAGLVWVTAFASRDVAIDRFDNSADDLRWPVWQSIIEALPYYMPWGTGIGSFAQAYQVLEPDRLLRPTYFNDPHNEFLGIAFTAGIPGLGLLAIAAMALFISLRYNFSHRGDTGAAAIFARLGGSVIVLLAIASTTDYPARTPILAAVLALASVWATLGAKGGAEQNHSKV